MLLCRCQLMLFPVSSPLFRRTLLHSNTRPRPESSQRRSFGKKHQKLIIADCKLVEKNPETKTIPGKVRQIAKLTALTKPYRRWMRSPERQPIRIAPLLTRRILLARPSLYESLVRLILPFPLPSLILADAVLVNAWAPGGASGMNEVSIIFPTGICFFLTKRKTPASGVSSSSQREEARWKISTTWCGRGVLSILTTS